MHCIKEMMMMIMIIIIIMVLILRTSPGFSLFCFSTGFKFFVFAAKHAAMKALEEQK